MLKRIAALFLIILSLSLQSCVSATSGLKSYADALDGYQFFYPNGWVPVEVKNGADVVLHDLIETSENVSVVINPAPSGQTLSDLGTPSEVGYKLSKSAIAPPDSGRQADLISADAYESGTDTYYLLEYAVKLPNNQERHNLASVVIRRGQLFTFNISTPESRWERMKAMFYPMAKSFSVY